MEKQSSLTKTLLEKYLKKEIDLGFIAGIDTVRTAGDLQTTVDNYYTNLAQENPSYVQEELIQYQLNQALTPEYIDVIHAYLSNYAQRVPQDTLDKMIENNRLSDDGIYYSLSKNKIVCLTQYANELWKSEHSVSGWQYARNWLMQLNTYREKTKATRREVSVLNQIKERKLSDSKAQIPTVKDKEDPHH